MIPESVVPQAELTVDILNVRLGKLFEIPKSCYMDLFGKEGQ